MGSTHLAYHPIPLLITPMNHSWTCHLYAVTNPPAISSFSFQYGLRQLDLSLLSQLWALNESIQEFRTMLQEQETLSPPSPTPSNSDVNSVSSDDDEDDSSNTQTVGAGLLTSHNLIESVAAASVLSSSQSSRMRAPPPPPPNRKAPSRPVWTESQPGSKWKKHSLKF